MKRLILVLFVLLSSCGVVPVTEKEQTIILDKSYDDAFASIVQYCVAHHSGVSVVSKETGIIVSANTTMQTLIPGFSERLSFNVLRLSDSRTTVFLDIAVVGQYGDKKMERKEYYAKVLSALAERNP